MRSEEAHLLHLAHHSGGLSARSAQGGQMVSEEAGVYEGACGSTQVRFKFWKWVSDPYFGEGGVCLFQLRTLAAGNGEGCGMASG